MVDEVGENTSLDARLSVGCLNRIRGDGHMAFVKRHAQAIGFLLMIAAMFIALVEVGNNADQVLYENAVQGCERGNVLRSVVYQNTRSAAETTPEGTFSRQLEKLRSVPTTNPITGEVDCRAIIPRP